VARQLQTTSLRATKNAVYGLDSSLKMSVFCVKMHQALVITK
jgi:hypothetical protein